MSLPKYVTDAIAAEVEDVVRSATLDSALERAVIRQLGGPNRVLPEGKANLCSAVTLLSSRSESPGEALAAVPAAAAMEMLMATGDLIDEIQDDEADLPDDRRSLGCLLQAVTLLVMLCHTSIGRLADSGVSARRVVRAYKVVDELEVRALRGQSLDIDMESRSQVPVEHSLDVSRLKSASLVMCAAKLGACAVTDDIEEIDLYGRFGWHFGLMAQLLNDVAAVWPWNPPKSDLRLRKKTLPIAFALNVPEAESRHAGVVRSYYDAPQGREPSIDEEEVRWALWRCGAIHYTWMAAAREKAEATKTARSLTGNPDAVDSLHRLLM